VALSETPLGTARDETIKTVSEGSFVRIMEKVLDHSPSTAARVAALINLAGGWDSFAVRVKTELLEMKSDEQKR
jgi:hypothetical protein